MLSLVTAARSGPLWVVDQILDHGADPNVENGQSLIEAARFGHASIVRELLNRGANPNLQNGEALVVAAKEGHLRVVQDLLQRIDPNIQNGKALIEAARNGHSSIVKELLDRGAKPNVLPPELRYLIPGLITPREYYHLESLIQNIQESPNHWNLDTSFGKFILLK